MASLFISPEGIEFEKKVGRKQDVWEMSAYQTSSGLHKEDLKLNRRGNVVSKLRSQRMAERFKKYGGLTKTEDIHKHSEEAKKQSDAYAKVRRAHENRVKRQAEAVRREKAKKDAKSRRKVLVRQQRNSNKS
jgi:hypothetical protein